MRSLPIIILLLISSMAIAQEKTTVKKDTTKTNYLKEVVVTATRTKKKIEDLPVPITLIKQKDIEKTNNNRISEVLEEYAGISTQEGGGGTHDIQLQGLNGEYVLFLIDGEPIVGRNSGGINIDRLSASNIKRIEVVKGAASSLYGSEAIGGVINIITKKTKSGFHGNAVYRVGSFSTHDANFNLGYKKDKFRISGYVNRYSTEGYDLTPNSFDLTRGPFSNYTLGAKLVIK
ncbi:TonB-dependent receptor plug domain-containing protein [Maribacter ulvicola]|uniref:Outer membrane receptor for ferrienterochelin and colicins n=1 Tax=Maribacter ulvicola TaxID=228959 RepID=A0A1N6QU38_9FLAO|nr:TonB-dependent receptor plug domain-containing protein [Maribacter ulvicola]SIQ20022.1 outer membrane receptor for ferrienterochelin and colicins [Maribacter ulvicola]